MWIRRLKRTPQATAPMPMGHPSPMVLWKFRLGPRSHLSPVCLIPLIATCAAALHRRAGRRDLPHRCGDGGCRIRPLEAARRPSRSIFRVSGHLAWPRWRASGRVFDARWRVWRPGDPSVGGGRAQRIRADDPAVSGRAEGLIRAVRALFRAAFGMRSMRKKLRCYRCCVRVCSWPTWWLGRV